MATLSSAVTIKRRESRIFNYVAIAVANIEIYIYMVANTVYTGYSQNGDRRKR